MDDPGKTTAVKERPLKSSGRGGFESVDTMRGLPKGGRRVFLFSLAPEFNSVNIASPLRGSLLQIT